MGGAARRYLLSILCLASLLGSSESWATPADTCAHSMGIVNPGPTDVPVTGEVRALFVFAQFPDEVVGVPNPCAPGEDPWPETAVNVPDWGLDLLSWDPPYAEGSLTHFFNLMSGGDLMTAGAHLLRGRVYPRVIKLTNGIQYYTCPAGAAPGIAAANKAVVDSVDADASWPLATDYDWNGDHVLDFVFVVYRNRFSPLACSELFYQDGISLLELPGDSTPVEGGTYSVATITVPNSSRGRPFVARAAREAWRSTSTGTTSSWRSTTRVSWI